MRARLERLALRGVARLTPTASCPRASPISATREKGAEEIRRNAKRGFTARDPARAAPRARLPWSSTTGGSRIIRACAETETVLNLHVGSAGFAKMPPGALMLELGATMFQAMAFQSCAEWRSGWPARYPELKIAMSEGGIAWVGGLIDRLDNIMGRSGYGRAGRQSISPSDCLDATSGSA
ncbi:MAG: amidohydrolase family protein [Myxococcota bacterium]